MPTIANKIKEDDKSKILKNVKIVGLSIGALLVLISIPLIYMSIKKKDE